MESGRIKQKGGPLKNLLLLYLCRLAFHNNVSMIQLMYGQDPFDG